jgi:hypothetical protein
MSRANREFLTNVAALPPVDRVAHIQIALSRQSDAGNDLGLALGNTPQHTAYVVLGGIRQLALGELRRPVGR